MTDLPASPLEPDPAIAPPPPTPPEPPIPVSKTPGWRSWAAAGVVAVAVVGGGVIATRHHGTSSPADVQASATPGQGGTGAQRFADRGAQGTIASIKGTTLTVTATDRAGATSTVKVTTTSSTTYTDAVAGKVSDLAVGDAVVVRGDDVNGAVTATDVTEGAAFGRGGAGGAPPTGTDQGPPAGFTPGEGQAGGGPGGGGFGGGGFTAGSIVSVSGGTFTVKSADGTQVVTTTSATTVTVTKDIALHDLKVGDTVVAIGARTDDTVVATSIRRGAGIGFGFGRRGTTSTTTSPS